MPSKTQICLKIYFQPADHKRYAAIAERMGKRRAGLLIVRQKKHGFAGQTIPNLSGIGRAMKAAMDYWEATEAERMEKAARLMAQQQQTNMELAKLGVQTGQPALGQKSFSKEEGGASK